jgi:putative phosphoesterase
MMLPMKYFILSDIHGSASACDKALSFFNQMHCDEIILLGDVLYHGPRNPLPDKYDPKAVCARLNPLADKIIACRGNCDSEVDQMVLSFPLLADYSYICDEGVRIFASHGHRYSPEKEGIASAQPSASEQAAGVPSVAGSSIPPLAKNDIELFGHIHIQKLYKTNTGITVCNPGSVSLPKEDSPAGFAVYEKKVISLYDMNGTKLRSLSL